VGLVRMAGKAPALCGMEPHCVVPQSYLFRDHIKIQFTIALLVRMIVELLIWPILLQTNDL
jgi:hypothetical protein